MKRSICIILALAFIASVSACGDTKLKSEDYEDTGIFDILYGTMEEVVFECTAISPVKDNATIPEDFCIEGGYALVEFDAQSRYTFELDSVKLVGTEDKSVLTEGTVVYIFYAIGDSKPYSTKDGKVVTGEREDAMVYFYLPAQGLIYRGEVFKGAPLKDSYSVSSVSSFTNRVDRKKVEEYLKSLVRE